MTGALSLRSAPLIAVPAAGGALVAAAAGSASQLPIGAVAAMALVAAFLTWPWSVLPASIILGSTAAMILRLTSVAEIIALHAGMLGAGMLALAIRALLGCAIARRATAADVPMALLTGLVALGWLYGMARGNGAHPATVAAYQVGIIPAYYWIATLTLGEEAARVRAGTLFVTGACALAAIGLVTPGRHGGLLSALALLPLLAAAARQTRPGTRLALMAGAGLLSVDIALGAYRSIWLAAGIALLVVALRGSRSERKGIVVALTLAVAVGLASFSLSPSISSRLAIAETQLGASSGYRLPEATVGLDVFASSPLVGAGLGQSTPGIYLPGFRLDDVGPVYHAFYVTVLANGGAVLLLVVVAAMLPALRLLLARRGGPSLPWAALLLGFLAAAAFAGPTDGHWELGLLPALALMAAGPGPRRAQRRITPVETRRTARSHRATAVDAGGSTTAPRCAGIAAVVVTYQSRDAIGPCLEALAESADRIVVVDNASRDGTATFVRGRYPAVEVIANADNVGFARAVNQGTARTNHDTVMLVNPDCVLASGTAHALRGHLCRHADVGIAAPRLLDSSGGPVVSVHRFETIFSVVASRFGGRVVVSRLRGALSWGARRATGAGGREALTVDWASGACLAVRGELLERLGGLDEGYFMYYEDEELCLQARREGASVAYLPGVSAQHVGGASSSDPAAIWPVLYTSMLRFFARHRPTSLPALRVVLVLRACIGVTLAAVRGRRRPALAWWRIARVALRSAPASGGKGS